MKRRGEGGGGAEKTEEVEIEQQQLGSLIATGPLYV